MRFHTPDTTRAFDIPDEWWAFAEMDAFSPSPGSFYPYSSSGEGDTQVVPLLGIEPPSRNEGVSPFRKYKLVPVLLAFSSPECALPPVEVSCLHNSGTYQYRVVNGYHRYYASVAVGYTSIPVVVRP